MLEILTKPFQYFELNELQKWKAHDARHYKTRRREGAGIGKKLANDLCRLLRKINRERKDTVTILTDEQQH